jgi:hypothetical protein
LDDSLRNEILPGDWSQLTRFDSGSPERNRREFKVYRLEFIDGTAIRVVGSSAVCTRGGRTFVL